MKGQHKKPGVDWRWIRLIGIVLCLAPLFVSSSRASCTPGDCTAAASAITSIHTQGQTTLMGFISPPFNLFRTWLTGPFLRMYVVPALMDYAEQMSAVGLYQLFIVGTFFDAKEQLERQRVFQRLQYEAHRDYQPSEGFCWFGSTARSLAASEARGRFNAQGLHARQLSRHLGNEGLSGALSADGDKGQRWVQFTERYCDPQDHNWTGSRGTGLTNICGNASPEYTNIDIDYTRLIEEPRSLDVSFSEQALGDTPLTANETDVLALGNNLYGHDVLRGPEDGLLRDEGLQELYLALRSVAAKRSVAEMSYSAIVGMKAYGGTDPAVNDDAISTRNYLGAVLKELGVPDNEIFDILGEDPSYYAQLEILAKKIYQNPDFFTSLYDKPANIERKSVAIKAIGLMLDRAIYESELRQELATSVLLSAGMREQRANLNRQLPRDQGGG